MKLCLNVISICMDVGELVGVYVGKSVGMGTYLFTSLRAFVVVDRKGNKQANRQTLTFFDPNPHLSSLLESHPAAP